MHQKYLKIIPTIVSILLCSTAFIYYVLQSSDNEKKLQLSPEKNYYSDKFEENISYTDKDISESSFFKNIRINKTAGVSEPKIICNPLNENILAVTANNFSVKENFATIFISLDKGLNWIEKQIPLSSIFESSSYSDPYIEFNSDGSMVFTAVQKDLQNGSREGLCFSISSDNGNNWKTNSDFIDYNGKNNIHIDKPSLVTGNDVYGNNCVFVTWTKYKGLKSLILFSGSTDGGSTFSSPVTIEEGRVKFSSIVNTSSGELFVAYIKNENEIRLNKSSNNGESWNVINSKVLFIPSGTYSDGQYLIKNFQNNAIRINSEPNVKVSENSDLLITFSSQSGGEDLSDIYFCRFLNSNSEFTKPVKVNTDRTNCDQFLPSITEDSLGNIIIVYQDSREDEFNLLINTYLSYSSDSGKTFSDKKISHKNFDPGKISVNKYIGDHNSCVFSGNDLIAVWTDGRNNNFDLYAGIFNFYDFINK